MKTASYFIMTALTAIFVCRASAAPATLVFETGVDTLSWSSDLDRQGNEITIPLSLQYRSVGGQVLLRLSSSFMSGTYQKEDLGYGGSEFKSSHMTDSNLQVALAQPWGRNTLSWVMSANLPSGDGDWELNQYAGRAPLSLMPTRFHGRGFGLNTMVGLGRDFGKWNLTAAGGYCYAGSQNLGLNQRDVDLGDFAQAGFVVSRGRGFKFQVSRQLSRNTQIDSAEVFKAPDATRVEARYQMGRKVRFGVEAGILFFGHASRLDAFSGDLVVETFRSFGTRFTLSPAAEYRWGPKTSFRTEGLFKSVSKNDYAFADPFYEGGGVGVGGAQVVRWKMGKTLASKYRFEYQRLVHRDAALDASLLPADVTYNLLSFGTGVEFQW